MKADADAAAAEEGDSDDSDEEREAMDVAEVQEKLEACSEVELKKMLKVPHKEHSSQAELEGPGRARAGG